MQAQRNFTGPAQPSGDTASVEDTPGWLPSPADPATAHQSSPTHMMLQELATRLQPPGTAGHVAMAPLEAKWPMPVRLAVIGGLSLSCWVAIGAAAFQLL